MSLRRSKGEKQGMTTKTLEVKEIELTNLLATLRQGNEIIVTDNGTPIAHLLPILPTLNRRAGLHSGAIWTSNDFDAPLPDNFWVRA